MEATAVSPETVGLDQTVPSRDLDMDKVAEYVRLSAELKAAESGADAIKKLRNALQTELMATFERGGLTRVGVDGMTVYVHRSLSASAAEGKRDELVAALRAAELDGLITYSPQSLSSYVRELEGKGEALPDSVKPLVSVYEGFSLRVVKGSR